MGACDEVLDFLFLESCRARLEARVTIVKAAQMQNIEAFGDKVISNEVRDINILAKNSRNLAMMEANFLR